MIIMEHKPNDIGPDRVIKMSEIDYPAETSIVPVASPIESTISLDPSRSFLILSPMAVIRGVTAWTRHRTPDTGKLIFAIHNLKALTYQYD